MRNRTVKLVRYLFLDLVLIMMATLIAYTQQKEADTSVLEQERLKALIHQLRKCGIRDISRLKYVLAPDLIEIGEPAVPYLLEIITMQKHRSAYGVLGAVEALGKLQEKRAVLPLYELLDNLDARWKYLWPPLVVRETAILTEKEVVAKTIAWNLGIIGDPRAASSLERGKNKFPGLKKDMQFAINKINILNSEDVVEELIRYLKTCPESREREWAAEELGKRKDKRIIPALISALSDADKYVREKAIKSLVSLEAKQALPHLIRMCLEEPQEKINWALEKLTGKSFSYSPYALRNEREEVMRKWQQWWGVSKHKYEVRK